MEPETGKVTETPVIVEPVILKPIEEPVKPTEVPDKVVVNVSLPVIPTEPEIMPENGIVEPVIEIPVVKLTGKVAEPVIPIEPEIAVPTRLTGRVELPVIPILPPATDVNEPDTGIVTEIPLRVEPVTDSPIEPVIFIPGIWETLVVNVVDPVIPTLPPVRDVKEPETGTVTDIPLKVEPVTDNPMEPVTLFPMSVPVLAVRVTEPVIPTEPPLTATEELPDMPSRTATFSEPAVVKAVGNC